MAAVAQQEREAISARTKAGLQSIRDRISANGFYVSRSGRMITRLGNPSPTCRPDHVMGTAAAKARADEFAGRVAPTASALRSGGMSLQAIADRLNVMGVRSARGSSWTSMAVKRVLDRTAVAAQSAG
jgi:DNA invertase Pin-like site-specific DNA recombinase